ncbi:substrate-binding domain-containing protein [Faecalicatena contorta]|uniref:substrate-binding domain-containing protein n=1 Tax=Faecalicatena contorta TaxID=39482 RepID=UPI001F42F240|nr:substrate-binding domain-containing protein [Faecalicatena contorta]MCF2668431.1 substrate-binding domain-containing protein [Faecalicatena contorta]
MKKSSSVLAVMLCVAMLACACAAPESSENKEPESSDNKQQVEEKEYQGKLDQIEPSAYDNVEGLHLEAGSYISIIGKAEEGQYWNEVKRGVDQAAADINDYLGYEGKDKVKVTYSAPETEDNVDEQVNILDEELARYPIAVGISITDANACEVQFDLAAENDIPVVAYDSGSAYQGLMATVSTDNAAAAREAATKLAKLIGDSGEIILFVNDSKSKTSLDRENAFREEIQNNHPNITIVESYHLDQLEDMQKIVADEINAGTYQIDEESAEAESDVQIAPADITEEDVIDYVLAKHPDIKGCFASNAPTVKKAIAGLERAEADDVMVVGFDADEEEKKALSDGRIEGLIVQNPFGMGYATVVAAARAALDMGNEAFVNTGYTWVTADNLEDENIQKMLY